MKKIIAGILIFIGVLALGVGLMFSKMPKKGPPFVELPGGVLGVLCRFSYSWIIPSLHGALLIDAGMDAKAPELIAGLRLKGLQPESVRAILITHGHPDHFGGAHAFPNARVIADAKDIPFMTGQKKRGGLVAGIFSKMAPETPPLKNLEALPDNGSISVDGVRFTVIRLPGHSPGSVGYLLGDILFSGDALMGAGGGVMPPPFFTSSDPDQSRAMLAMLLKVSFSVLADGHTGAVFDAHRKLEEYLKK